MRTISWSGKLQGGDVFPGAGMGMSTQRGSAQGVCVSGQGGASGHLWKLNLSATTVEDGNNSCKLDLHFISNRSDRFTYNLD